MLISKRTSTITSRFVSPAIVVLVTALAFSAAAQDLKSSVYGNKKNSSQKTRGKSQKKKTQTAKKQLPVTAKNYTNTTKNYANTSKKFSADNFLSVTFVGKEPFVEVWLNGRIIGSTDNKLQFTKKLAPGKYRLMAKNKREVFLTSKEITISPEKTSFNLYNEPPPQIIPVADTVEEPKIQEKTEMDVAVEISNKVRAILENYANPATTDSVTLDDWQIVFQAAQFGQLQGYTAVQIEAQRWFASGQIELAKKEYNNALTAFTKAQEFMPTSALPFYALGNTYLSNSQPAEALKFYLKALQIDPKLAMGYKKLGDTERLLDKEKEAINAYKNAIKFGYSTAETRFWLGTLLLDSKQIEDALKILEEVAKEMPKAEVFITIGSGYERLKRDVSAIEFYQKAIEADPNSALAYYKLGDVYTGQREYTKAKDAFEKAIALDAEGKQIDLPEVQKKLREITAKINNK